MFLWLHPYMENLGDIPKRKTYTTCPFYSTHRADLFQEIHFYDLMEILPFQLHGLGETEKSSIIWIDDSRDSSQPQQFCNSVSANVSQFSTSYEQTIKKPPWISLTCSTDRTNLHCFAILWLDSEKYVRYLFWELSQEST